MHEMTHPGRTLLALTLAVATVLSVFVSAGVAVSGTTDDLNLNAVANEGPIEGPRGITFAAVCDYNDVTPEDLTDITFSEPLDGRTDEYRTLSINSTRNMDFVVYRQGAQFYELDLEYTFDKKSVLVTIEAETGRAVDRSADSPCRSNLPGVKRVPGGEIEQIRS